MLDGRSRPRGKGARSWPRRKGLRHCFAETFATLTTFLKVQYPLCPGRRPFAPFAAQLSA
jgi:hypothetical protein